MGEGDGQTSAGANIKNILLGRQSCFTVPGQNRLCSYLNIRRKGCQEQLVA